MFADENKKNLIINWGPKSVSIFKSPSGVVEASHTYWFQSSSANRIDKVLFGSLEQSDLVVSPDGDLATCHPPDFSLVQTNEVAVTVIFDNGETEELGKTKVILAHQAVDKIQSSELETIQKHIAQELLLENPLAGEFYASQYANAELQYWLPALDWIENLGTINSILDIGGGYGTLLCHAINKTGPNRKVLLDKVPVSPKNILTQYNIDFFESDIEKDDCLDPQKFDLIIFTEILEHLNFHPSNTLKKLGERLSPEGHIILSTPNANEWGKNYKYYKSIDDIPVYTGQDTAWIDDHIWHYNFEEIKVLCDKTELRIENFKESPGNGRSHLCFLLSKSS